MGESDTSGGQVREIEVVEGEELPPVKTNTRTRFVLKTVRPETNLQDVKSWLLAPASGPTLERPRQPETSLEEIKAWLLTPASGPTLERPKRAAREETNLEDIKAWLLEKPARP